MSRSFNLSIYETDPSPDAIGHVIRYTNITKSRLNAISSRLLLRQTVILVKGWSHLPCNFILSNCYWSGSDYLLSDYDTDGHTFATMMMS